jgi:type VI secretion system secreted protein Hcp
MNPKKTTKEVKAMKRVGEMRNWLQHLGKHCEEPSDNQLKTKKKGERTMKRLERIGLVILAVAVILMSFPLNSEAAFDAFLQIDGIPGESTDDAHKDWIEILSFGQSICRSFDVTPDSYDGATAADFGDFVIVKAMDKSSPKLAVACADGTHIKEVVLELCRAGGDKMLYMEYILEDVIVSCYEPGGRTEGGDSLPLETVSLRFNKIQWTYTQQKRADGSGGGNVSGGWDLVKDSKF